LNLVTDKFCIVPMDTLRSDTYGYTFRELIVVRVRAYNFYGWGDDYSEANTSGALCRIEPS